MDSSDDYQGIQLAEGYKIVELGPIGTYIGQTDAENKPSGHGFLVFTPPPGKKGYSQHEGEFVSGVPNGPGVYVSNIGEEIEGEWKANKRVGMFMAHKPSGSRFVEKYGEEGKLKSRKKSEEPGEKPVECWQCGGLYRETFNNPYSCRVHRGEWRGKGRFQRPDADPASEEGVWSCCIKETFGHPGCEFKPHNLKH